MALALETVVKQLTDSGIIAPGKLENFVPPKATPKDGEALLRELHKQKLLTTFQAQQVAANKIKALILGNYIILDKIGAGGMGQVFKAEHRRMKRLVAIKMLPAAMLQDAAAAARFQREVEAAAKLEHPNIVHANDADESNGIHFLVMQYVEGNDLSVLVKKNGPFPVGKAVNYILQAARGLEFAHSKGVIHRDIKPANLLLGNDGVVKILDMGLARIESDGPAQTELTGSGTIMGTVDYMSPEQALNTKHADHRADIYSLGISLYYLLAGKSAYGGETAMEKLMAHTTQPIPSLQEVQTTVPKQLEAVFKKMVAKKMEDRYQSMTEVIEALEDLGIGGSTTARKGEVASTVALSPEQKKKLAATAKKKPRGSITDVVASEKTKHLFLKIIGGTFATIIAPILVTYLIKHLEKKDEPAKPPAAVADATVPVVEASNTSSQPAVPVASGGGQPNKPWNTPAFQAWVKEVQAMPAEEQVKAVSKKLVELNPGFDGKVFGVTSQSAPKIENGVVTAFGFISDSVSNVSPVRALLGLKTLTCGNDTFVGRKLSDLSPLSGMQLTTFDCATAKVSDLTALRGMPLKTFACNATLVTDLSAIAGMPLTSLNVSLTAVSDLSVLRGMKLTFLACQGTKVSDLSPLNDCTTLHQLHVSRTKVTPASIAALQKALPNCKIEWDDPARGFAQSTTTTNLNDPAFLAWMKDVQAMPAEKQVDAVAKKLQSLNPAFDGKVTPQIEKGVITRLRFITDNVTDISPVRALVGLGFLHCYGSTYGKGRLFDLSPLKGLPLTTLECGFTQVSDLTPLHGMPLTTLDCRTTQISDLAPLNGMSLTIFNCQETNVSDVSPLKDMPLTNLNLMSVPVSDLSPLKGMSLTTLICDRTQVSDLSPLQGMPLTTLHLYGTPVSDVTPLKSVSTLRSVSLKNTKVTPAAVAALQKALPDCKIVGNDPDKATTPARPITNVREPVFQQWVKETQALPAEQQIEAVSKRLMELNPGFDGKVTGADGNGTPKIESGVVTQLRFVTVDVTDISPVRALLGLKVLRCVGSGLAGGKSSNLSPLEGMPLTTLSVHDTLVSDLSPLASMLTLGSLDVRATKVTPAAVAALQKALPNCKIEWNDPAKPKTPEPADSGTK